MSGLGGKPMEYAFFEHFCSGDDCTPCTQDGCLHEVLHAENWKQPKGVGYRERVRVTLGQRLSQGARR